MPGTIIYPDRSVQRQDYSHLDDGELLVSSIFATLQGEGPFAGRRALFIRLAGCNLGGKSVNGAGCPFCFAAGTKVQMAYGSVKPIEQVEPGDSVLSYDERTEEFVVQPVLRRMERQTSSLLSVQSSSSDRYSDRTYVTHEHPFLVKGKGWVEAKDLVRGDVLLTLSNSDQKKLFNPMRDDQTRRRVSETLKQRYADGELEAPLKRLWRDPNFRAEQVERMRNENPMKDPQIALKGFLNRRDRGKRTSLESRVERLAQEHDLPISFVGDGALTVANKVPDFVVDGQRKLVEVWPSDQTHHFGRDEAWVERRRSLFAGEGYETLFLEVSPEVSDAALASGVREFVRNGHSVKAIRPMSEGVSYWNRLLGEGPAMVYNLEVANTHTYVADGKIVHNCDTNFRIGEGSRMQPSAIVEAAREKAAFLDSTRRELVVITGGEPLLQLNITQLIEELVSTWPNTDVQIETNGTQYAEVGSAYLVVSPKIPEVQGKSLGYGDLRRSVFNRADCLKLLVSADPNSPYYRLPDYVDEFAATGRPVYISPINVYQVEPTSRSSLFDPHTYALGECQRNHEHAAKICFDKGHILSVQEHLLANLP